MKIQNPLTVKKIATKIWKVCRRPNAMNDGVIESSADGNVGREIIYSRISLVFEAKRQRCV